MLEISITPVPKPRMTQRDKWAQRPVVVRYHTYCDKLRYHWGNTQVPATIGLRFLMPMPVSWSKKKRLEMLGAPHQQKPDIDNLVKAFLDCLCEDDAYVWSLKGEKVWSETGAIQVTDIDELDRLWYTRYL